MSIVKLALNIPMSHLKGDTKEIKEIRDSAQKIVKVTKEMNKEDKEATKGSLIKLAANAWQKRLLMTGSEGGLSRYAIKKIHDTGIARPIEQMASGLARGNEALSKRFNAKIVNTVHDAGKEFGNKGGLLNKLKGKIIGIGSGSKAMAEKSALTIPANITYSKNNLIVGSRGTELGPAKNKELIKQLINRHELHEARYMHKPVGTRSSGYFNSNGRIIGSHMNIGVLSRESNDIARLRGYKEVAPFYRARNFTTEAPALQQVTKQRYGSFVNNKELKRIERIQPENKSFIEKLKNGISGFRINPHKVD